jgi:hypothetical protein
MLRGMHHKRIKYNDDLVKEFGKNKQQTQNLIPKPIIAQPSLDVDLDEKVKELESKKNETLSKQSVNNQNPSAE